MRITWTLIVAVCFGLVGATATASDPLDHAECNSQPDELICRVMVALENEFDIYSQQLIEAEHPWPQDWEPLFLGQRLMLAIGRVVQAFESSKYYHASPGLVEPLRVMGVKTSPIDALSWIEIASSHDPVPVVSDEEINALSEMGFSDSEIWAQLMTARILAADGRSDEANTLFSSLNSDWPLSHAPIDSSLHFFWASAGEAEAAIASVDPLFPITRGFVQLSIAEGLAMQGDIVGVEAQIDGLPGDLPVLGILPLAEAHRRAGDADGARELLDRARIEISRLGPGLRGRSWDIRLAQGYAILGDSETAITILAPYVDGDDYPFDSNYIAPLVACYDFDRALSLIAQESLDGTVRYLSTQLTELLIAAAASGNGEQVFDFAQRRESLVERTLSLMAVSIGLVQGRNLPDDAPACATRTFLYP